MLEIKGFPYFEKNEKKTNVDYNFHLILRQRIFLINHFHCCLKLIWSELKASEMSSHENIQTPSTWQEYSAPFWE